jgi:predicted nucleic acid-binding protein
MGLQAGTTTVVILLDTSVVSAVLRRKRKGPAEEQTATQLAALLQTDEPIALPGIVLQELLSGLADRKQHERVLRAIQDSFPVLLATEGDHRNAADVFSACVAAGVSISTPDALIAAQTLNRRARLFTTDADFRRLPAAIGLRLV